MLHCFLWGALATTSHSHISHPRCCLGLGSGSCSVCRILFAPALYDYPTPPPGAPPQPNPRGKSINIDAQFCFWAHSITWTTSELTSASPASMNPKCSQVAGYDVRDLHRNVTINIVHDGNTYSADTVVSEYLDPVILGSVAFSHRKKSLFNTQLSNCFSANLVRSFKKEKDF